MSEKKMREGTSLSLLPRNYHSHCSQALSLDQACFGLGREVVIKRTCQQIPTSVIVVFLVFRSFTYKRQKKRRRNKKKERQKRKKRKVGER